MKEQFLIQVEQHPETRLCCDQEEMARAIAQLVSNVYRIWSTGPMPAITVSQLENSNEMDLTWLMRR